MYFPSENAATTNTNYFDLSPSKCFSIVDNNLSYKGYSKILAVENALNNLTKSYIVILIV